MVGNVGQRVGKAVAVSIANPTWIGTIPVSVSHQNCIILTTAYKLASVVCRVHPPGLIGLEILPRSLQRSSERRAAAGITVVQPLKEIFSVRPGKRTNTAHNFRVCIDLAIAHTRCFVQLMESSADAGLDRKCTRLNSSHVAISYAVFCLK